MHVASQNMLSGKKQNKRSKDIALIPNPTYTFPQVDPVTGMVINIVELKHAMEVGIIL